MLTSQWCSAGVSPGGRVPFFLHCACLLCTSFVGRYDNQLLMEEGLFSHYAVGTYCKEQNLQQIELEVGDSPPPIAGGGARHCPYISSSYKSSEHSTVSKWQCLFSSMAGCAKCPFFRISITSILPPPVCIFSMHIIRPEWHSPHAMYSVMYDVIAGACMVFRKAVNGTYLAGILNCTMLT